MSHRRLRDLVVAAAVAAIAACGPSAREQAEEAARREAAAKLRAAEDRRRAVETHQAKMAAWQAEQAKLATKVPPSKPAQPPQPQRGPSMSARAWLNSGVKASLDQTTLEQFMAQVPTGVAQPSWTRDGDDRTLTLAFNGGGRVLATFRASDVVGAGLVLYSVDIQD